MNRIAVCTTIACALAAAIPPNARAETLKIPHGYHYQQTSFYCGPGSIHMMLDTPAVRNNNANVQALLTNPPPMGSGLTQDQWVQLQLYAASRPRNFLPIAGTDPVGFSLTINAYDGIPNGPALPNGIPQSGNPAHAYAWYGFVPTIFGGDLASRTVAAALKTYHIPATVAVGHGAHWVVVDGVSTQGDIALNGNYKITGFRVSDPWTGFARANPAPGQPKGLGINSWYRYGFNVNGRQGAWFNFFNPVNPAPAPYGGQYVVVVEPDPPIPPDDGNGGMFNSFPDPAPMLPEPLTAATAVAHVQGLVSNPDDFLHEFFSAGGAFEPSLVSFMTFPDDLGGNGDWLIPFDGPAPGNDDLLGAVLVDSMTGVINHATWLNDGDDPFSLNFLMGFYDDLYDLNLPQDDVLVPAPTSIILIGVAGVFALRRRRQEQAGRL